MVTQRITSDQYMQALKRGYSAEKRVRSVLLGGHVYRGYFYSVDKHGYLRVKIDDAAAVKRLDNHRSQLRLEL